MIVATENGSISRFASAITDVSIGTAPAFCRQRLKFDESIHCESIPYDLPDRFLLDVSQPNIGDKGAGSHCAVRPDREHEISPGTC